MGGMRACAPVAAMKNMFSLLSLDVDDADEQDEAGDARKSSQKKASAVAPGKKALRGSKSDGVKNGSSGKSENDEKNLKDTTNASKSVPAPAPDSASASKEGETADVRNLRWPLVWIDLEMTGLDIEKDRILEIACIITDGKLVKLIEGPDLVINQPDEALAGMGEWCQTQHTASGLVESVQNSKITEQEAEMQVLEFVQKHTTPEKAQLAGNSVYNDLNFLRKYMPRLAAHFSHVIVDVSSIKALCYRWYPRDAEKAPAKKNNHRALDDIKESIAELKYLRKAIFKDPQRWLPG